MVAIIRSWRRWQLSGQHSLGYGGFNDDEVSSRIFHSGAVDKDGGVRVDIGADVENCEQ